MGDPDTLPSFIPTTTTPIEDVVITAVLVVYGTLLSFGALMCLVFALALIRGRKQLAQWPFYSIVHHLLFLDTVYLLYQLVKVFPSMVVVEEEVVVHEALTDAKAWYNTKYVRAAFSMLDCIPLKGLIYLTLLMTINRMAVFVIPALRPIFTKPKITWSLLVCWLFILLLCFLSVLVRPTQKFNRTSLRFEDIGEPIVKAPALRDSINVLDYIIPFVMLIISITTRVEVQDKSGDDNRMLLQAIVITVFLQLYNVTEISETLIADKGLLDYILNMTSLILSVANHSIHSTIFLLTNPTIRGFLPHPSFACWNSMCKRTVTAQRSLTPVKPQQRMSISTNKITE